jgi:hypothetical protein
MRHLQPHQDVVDVHLRLPALPQRGPGDEIPPTSVVEFGIVGIIGSYNCSDRRRVVYGWAGVVRFNKIPLRGRSLRLIDSVSLSRRST